MPADQLIDPSPVVGYRGRRSASTPLIWARLADGTERFIRHSDGTVATRETLRGLDWQAAPAVLARAILLEHGLDRVEVAHLGSAFRWEVVAGFPRDGWDLTSVQIEEWLLGARTSHG